MSDKMVASYWGIHQAGSYDFLLSKGYEDPMCPFDPPGTKTPCPHLITSGFKLSDVPAWKKKVYFVTEEGYVPEVRRFLPEGIELTDQRLSVISADFPPSIKQMAHLLGLTNLIPLFVVGVKVNQNHQKLFAVMKAFGGIRPVYMFGSKYVPVPTDYEKLNLENTNLENGGYHD